VVVSRDVVARWRSGVTHSRHHRSDRFTQRPCLPRSDNAASLSRPTHTQWRRNRGFRRFNEPGAPSSWGFPTGATNFRLENIGPILQGFQQQERSSENTKSIKTLGGWGTPLGELTPVPRPGSRPSPKLHPRSQHFGLPASALGAEATEGPQVTVEPGPPRALLGQLGQLSLASLRGRLIEYQLRLG